MMPITMEKTTAMTMEGKLMATGAEVPAYQPVVTEPTTVPTTEPTTEETTVPTQPPTETKAVTEPTVTEAPSQGDEVNQGDETPTE